jgi:hypothetical protein
VGCVGCDGVKLVSGWYSRSRGHGRGCGYFGLSVIESDVLYQGPGWWGTGSTELDIAYTTKKEAFDAHSFCAFVNSFISNLV